MKNRNEAWSWTGGVTLGSLAVVSTGLLGCEGEPPPPPPPIVQAPPPPPPPPPPSIEQIRGEMNIDERIVLNEADAPRSPEDRRAVLGFFDAFARGNSVSVREMLTPEEQVQLADLMSSGEWDRSIEGIEQIDVVTGPGPRGELAVLAIFQVDSEFQPTLWYLTSGPDGPQFEAVPTPPDILDRVSGQDIIAAWHEVLEGEWARASEPDIDLQTPQTVLEQRGEGEGPPPDQPTDPGPGPATPGPGPGSPGPGPGVPL